MRGSRILTMAEVVSLKYMEELVQDRDDMWVAEIWPPNRAMWIDNPPTQWAITWILVFGPCISRIREITTSNNERKGLHPLVMHYLDNFK